MLIPVFFPTLWTDDGIPSLEIDPRRLRQENPDADDETLAGIHDRQLYDGIAPAMMLWSRASCYACCCACCGAVVVTWSRGATALLSRLFTPPSLTARCWSRWPTRFSVALPTRTRSASFRGSCGPSSGSSGTALIGNDGKGCHARLVDWRRPVGLLTLTTAESTPLSPCLFLLSLFSDT